MVDIDILRYLYFIEILFFLMNIFKDTRSRLLLWRDISKKIAANCFNRKCTFHINRLISGKLFRIWRIRLFEKFLFYFFCNKWFFWGFSFAFSETGKLSMKLKWLFKWLILKWFKNLGGFFCGDFSIVQFSIREKLYSFRLFWTFYFTLIKTIHLLLS